LRSLEGGSVAQRDVLDFLEKKANERYFYSTEALAIKLRKKRSTIADAITKLLKWNRQIEVIYVVVPSKKSMSKTRIIRAVRLKK